MIALQGLVVLITVVAAIPAPHDGDDLVIQADGLGTKLNLHTAALKDGVQSESQKYQLDSLDVESWTAVQDALAGPRSGTASPDRNFVEKVWNRVLDVGFGNRPKPPLIPEFSENWKLPIPGHIDNHHWPIHWIPHEPIDLSNWTIGQILNWTLLHHKDEKVLPLVKFAWLVNLTESVQDTLLDEKANLTVFAEDDEALTPPHSRPHQAFFSPRNGPKTRVDLESRFGQLNTHPFWEAQDILQQQKSHNTDEAVKIDDDDDDERRERRRRLIKFLIKQTLRYHISPGEKSVHDLLDASTLETTLPISHEENSPLFRIRVGKPRPIPLRPITLNFISELGRPIRAKNGVIYIIRKAPLLPPLTPLSDLFLFPNWFSTLTTAIQKVGLAEDLLPKHNGKTIPFGSSDDEVDERVVSVLQNIASEEHEITRLSYTIFAPTNRAFKKLGLRLNSFLFSPFGAKHLRYILKYHVIPNVIFHSDHIDKVDETTDFIDSIETDVAWPSTFNFGPHQGHSFPPRDSPGRHHSGDGDDHLLESSEGHFFPGFPSRHQPGDGGDPSHGPPEGRFPPGFSGRHQPHDDPHGSPPHGPPHWPSPHGSPGHVNITHFTFPTLLGSRSNETISVDLLTYRLRFGHGPIGRTLVVQPPPVDGKEFPPIKVVVADGVAWGGAIHVIPDVIRPPHSHHEPELQKEQLAQSKFFFKKIWEDVMNILI